MRPLPILVALVLAGCGKAAPAPMPTPTGTKLLEAGGSGQDVTAAFEVKGRTLRVGFRLSQMPANRRLSLALERDGGDGNFGDAGTADVEVPDGLTGSKTLAVNPGRYRLRVITEGTWSATLYESP